MTKTRLCTCIVSMGFNIHVIVFISAIIMTIQSRCKPPVELLLLLVCKLLLQCLNTSFVLCPCLLEWIATIYEIVYPFHEIGLPANHHFYVKCIFYFFWRSLKPIPSESPRQVMMVSARIIIFLLHVIRRDEPAHALYPSITLHCPKIYMHPKHANDMQVHVQ